VCEPVFVFDSTDARIAEAVPLLSLFGPAVDGAGLEPREIADRLAELDVAGVTTFSETCIQWASAVATELGLPFHDVEVARALTDKSIQRPLLTRAGVGGPVESVGIQDLARLEDAVRELGLPCVLKPAHGAGSRMTFCIETPEDLEAVVALVRGRSPDEEFVLERRIVGSAHPAAEWLTDYVSVESATCGGETRHFCISDRLRPDWPARETGLVVPSALPAATRAAVEDVATAALNAIGVTTGITHTEVKLTLPVPTVIEVNGRLGGDVGRLLARASGYDAVAAAFQLALGRPVGTEPRFRTVAASYFPNAPAGAGRVHALPALSDVRAVAGVWMASPARQPGDSVSWVNGEADRLYDIMVEGNTLAEVGETIRTLGDLFRRDATYEPVTGDPAPVSPAGSGVQPAT
jgi:biotin carboxylase